jgi:hypothetical protein
MAAMARARTTAPQRKGAALLGTAIVILSDWLGRFLKNGREPSAAAISSVFWSAAAHEDRRRTVSISRAYFSAVAVVKPT